MVFTKVKDEAHFKQLILNNPENSVLTICYFTASWCGPCQTISPYVEDIGETNEHLSVLKIDVDECEDVSEQCEITCMPTFQFYKTNSPKPIHTFSGADKDELINTIKLLLKTDGEESCHQDVVNPNKQNRIDTNNEKILYNSQDTHDKSLNHDTNTISGFSGSHQLYANLNNSLNDF